MRFRTYVIQASLLAIALSLALSSCSQPILEPESCMAARDVVKRLYSIHMDGGVIKDSNSLDRIKPFLSDTLLEQIKGEIGKSFDYLTQTENFPKAFRVGGCKVVDGKPEFSVLLFWKTEEKSTQREIIVSTTKTEGWVVEKVKSK
ncbi:MAG: hypothetical protein R2684_09430 [Pyrinomonadaceae bacterium]